MLELGEAPALVRRQIGRRVQRREDDRLLRGAGRFVDDLEPAHTLHMAVGRSPFPYARILSVDVSQALADAFWHHFGGRPHRTILTHWTHLKMFARFVTETAALRVLPELDGRLLGRYVEWLNRQCRPSGSPWSKSTRAGAYTTLRKLLQWLERCRPGLLPAIEYPFNPFPWRNRDSGRFARLSAAQLRGLLRACERDIAASDRKSVV